MREPAHYRALIFDIDDTLVDDTAVWRRSVGETSRLLAERLAVRRLICTVDIAAAYKKVSDDLWSNYDELLRPLGDLKAIRSHVWATALSSIGVAADAADVSFAVDDFSERRLAGIQPTPRLNEGLRQLADKYRLGVCTNGSAQPQKDKLARAGLADLFPVMVSGRDLGVLKPAPEVFRQACHELSTPPDRCLYIGDDWDLDVVGAQAAGLDAVWIDGSGVDACDRAAGPDEDVVAAGRVARFADVTALVSHLVGAGATAKGAPRL